MGGEIGMNNSWETQKERMEIRMESNSQNEAFARAVAGAFVARMDPTLEEVEDVKTAVSEAVSNAVVHGYENSRGEICLRLFREDDRLRVEVEDYGVGIEDVKEARRPLFTTKPDADRSGMGFYFMEAFMQEVQVESEPGKGTRVIMYKTIGRR